MPTDPQLPVRETWNTRGAFVLAAIGSAVGLGNLWGFPYKLYTYGGGAFLIPYFLAMLIMGIPLLIMEFSVGHWAQHAPPGAFAKITKKYRFAGWWLVGLAFVIITYYAVILAYCIDYLVVSLASLGGKLLPWTADTAWAAKHYLLTEMVHHDGTMALGPPARAILIGSLASWLLIYFCLFRGVKWVSKVVLITVPLPWIMLLVLTIRGLTLHGAITGLEFYLEPRWAKLLEPNTWRYAFGQVFFSMSLGFAVMLSYASFLHRRSDLNNNAMIIGLGDMGTSFIAGIAVFAMLGGMSLASGQPVPDLIPGDSTVGLSFIVFPYGLSKLPASALFSVVFFLALLTLGIDSAFSIVEACLASVCDSKKDWPRKYVLPAICIIGFVIGLIFTCSRGGLNWLGLTDGLINGPFGILIVALAECLIVGWAWRGEFVKEMRNHSNERSDWKLYAWWDITVKYVAPAFLAVLIVWSVSGEIHDQIDAYKASLTPESREYQKFWPEYKPLKKDVEDATEKVMITKKLIYQAKLQDTEKISIDTLENELADQEVALDAANTKASPYVEKLNALKADAEANGHTAPTLVYSLPFPLILGSALFLILPVVCWIGSREKRPDKDGDDRKGARTGILYAASIMIVSGIMIELARARGWLVPREVNYSADGQLNATAYVFLAIGLLAITGGLVWCFWKAMQAAGDTDTEIEEPSTD